MQCHSAHHSPEDDLKSQNQLVTGKQPNEDEPRTNAEMRIKSDDSRTPMHSRLPVLKLLNYQITRLPNLSRLPSLNSRVTQSWFQLLCLRSGCRRILRTKAGGLAAVNPACAEAAAVHGRTACSAASARKGMDARFQLSGGNGSRQQNGRHNSRKQCGLTSLSHHGFEAPFLKKPYEGHRFSGSVVPMADRKRRIRGLLHLYARRSMRPCMVGWRCNVRCKRQ
jgi:hypothetical protein